MTFRKALVPLLLGSFISINSIANTENSEFNHYNNALIAVSYEGKVGDLLQQIANRLNVGYFNYGVDPNIMINVSQSNEKSLLDLLTTINQQIGFGRVGFEKLGNRTLLVLVGDDKPITGQYIGDIVFKSEEKLDTKTNDETATTVTTQPQEVAAKENFFEFSAIPSTETTKELAEKVGAAIETTALAPAIDIKETQESKPEKITSSTENKSPQENPAKTEAVNPSQAMNDFQIVRDIVRMSTDKTVIEQYASRTIPKYTIEKSSNLIPESIRNTEISTFLIFKEGKDVSGYKVNGIFDKVASVSNLITILHRETLPPKQITITSPDNKEKLILNIQ